jgi:uncharacterized protein YjiK
MNMKIIYLLLLMALSGWACGDSGAPVASPPGYDLKSPEKFVMGDDLHEISGIVFLPGKDDSLYAIEDEDGRLFYFKPGGDKEENVKFGKRGDFEDVAVVDGNTFVVLRSDGSLYVFAAGDVRRGEKLANVNELPNVLPEGEYEGLYGASDSTLYALCKNCKLDDQRDGVSVYQLRRQPGGSIGVKEHFTVDVSNINLPKEQRRGKFRPSALARHPITREWYILSSVNKILLVLNDQWKVKAAYSLKPSLFKQPEGLAFDSKGNMYVSNEGGDGNANVLLFKYNQPR